MRIIICIILILCLLPAFAPAQTKAGVKADLTRCLNASRGRLKTVEALTVKSLEELLNFIPELRNPPGETPGAKLSYSENEYTRQNLRSVFPRRTESASTRGDSYRILREGDDKHTIVSECPDTNAGIAEVWKRRTFSGTSRTPIGEGSVLVIEGPSYATWFELAWDEEDRKWIWPTRKQIRAYMQGHLNTRAGERAYRELTLDRARRACRYRLEKIERQGQLVIKALGGRGDVEAAAARLNRLKEYIKEQEQAVEKCRQLHGKLQNIEGQIARIVHFHAAWGGKPEGRAVPPEARRPLVNLTEERDYLSDLEIPIDDLNDYIKSASQEIESDKARLKWDHTDKKAARAAIRSNQQRIIGYKKKLLPLQKEQAQSEALIRTREIELAEDYLVREEALEETKARRAEYREAREFSKSSKLDRKIAFEKDRLAKLRRLLGKHVLAAARKGALKAIEAPAGGAAGSGKKQTVLVLKDGTRITGSVVATMPDQLSIMTAKRELVMVKLADIKERSETGAAPVKVDPQPAPAELPPGHEAFKMKDGTTVTGKVTIRTPDMIMLKTAAGKMVTLETKDIVTE